MRVRPLTDEDKARRHKASLAPRISVEDLEPLPDIPRRVARLDPAANPKHWPTTKPRHCGKTMIMRNGPYGQFYGCATYPRCKQTRPPSSVVHFAPNARRRESIALDAVSGNTRQHSVALRAPTADRAAHAGQSALNDL